TGLLVPVLDLLRVRAAGLHASSLGKCGFYGGSSLLTPGRKQGENRLVRTGPIRVDELREMLLQAGLADRVRVGASSPPPEVAAIPVPHRTSHPTSERTEQTPGTEETFSPDALLRPTFQAEGRLIELQGGLSSGKTALAYRTAALASA